MLYHQNIYVTVEHFVAVSHSPRQHAFLMDGSFTMEGFIYLFIYF